MLLGRRTGTEGVRSATQLPAQEPTSAAPKKMLSVGPQRVTVSSVGTPSGSGALLTNELLSYAPSIAAAAAQAGTPMLPRLGFWLQSSGKQGVAGR